MRILVTGANGQLGHDVMNELLSRGHDAVASGSSPQYRGPEDGTPVTMAPFVQMDITDAEDVEAVFSRVRPDAVIHCSAWTAVDAAEEPENRGKVYALNVTGPRNLAAACAKHGCSMMQISTDYVFSGDGEEPWMPEQEDYRPINYYGETKLMGEQAVRSKLEKYFVVRTAWVFGYAGNNFVKTMLRLGQTHTQLRVVNDQIGTPTYTKDLTRLLADMVVTDKYGVYHATNEGGYISWYDFAREIFRQAAMMGRAEYAEERLSVLPVSTAEYGLSKAARPFNSRLDKSKLCEMGFEPLPDWRDALGRYLREYFEER